MKIEKRGKYAGVKVHLDPEECEHLIAFSKTKDNLILSSHSAAVKLTGALGKKIKDLIVSEPDLLKDRSEDEIKKELENELTSAQLKLEAISKKKDWKVIHVS